MKARTIFGTVCLMVIATSLVAQTTMLRADIPFSFYVGNKVMPAGQYTVLQLNETATVLQLSDRSASKVFITHSAQRKEAITEPVMVFRHIGDLHFLSQIWNGDGNQGRELAPSKVQVQVARKGLPSSDTLILMARK